MEHLKSFKIFESVTKHVFDNRVEYRNDKNQLHREDGPAREYANGSKYWYINGKCHRENGPAIEYANGTKSWYLNGQLHREDGPAVEWNDGVTDWYLNNRLISKSQFIQSLTNQDPNPNLFKDLPIEDLEELATDLSDKYIADIKQYHNFYAIYFKEKLDKNDPDLKSFKNRLGDFWIRVGIKSILVY